MQPCPTKLPIVGHRAGGNAEQFGDLLVGQPAEEAELDHLGGSGVLAGERVDFLVDAEHVGVARRVRRRLWDFRASPLPAAAPLSSETGSGVVHQDPPHGLCRGAEEMPAVLESTSVLVDQPDKRLVHEDGGLEGVPGAFPGHLRLGNHAEFVLDQPVQLGDAMLIEGTALAKQTSDRAVWCPSQRWIARIAHGALEAVGSKDDAAHDMPAPPQRVRSRSRPRPETAGR